MSLTIKKVGNKLCIENVVYLYFLGTVLFSGYIEHSVVWNLLCILCLITLGILSNGFTYIAKNKNLVCSLLILLFMLVVCTVSSIGDMKYYFANIRSILYPICVILSFYIIQKRKPNMIMNNLTGSSILLNIWLIINLIILRQQVNRNFIFIKDAWLQQNPYWRDHCDGLFGANSTDILGYFIILIIILNIHCINTLVKRRWKKNALIIYTMIISAYSLYLFTKNDGVAQFILLPLAVLYQGLISKNKKLTADKILKIFKYAIAFLIVVAFLCSLEPVRVFMIDKVKHKVETMLKFRTTTAEIRGSNERIAIAAHGLSNGWGWGLGKGIGYLKWQAQNAFGFDHFGISSIGSLINLTGIWFYFCMCFFYTNVWHEISQTCRRIKGKIINFWMLFANVILMTIYLFVFTEIRNNICIMLILIVLYNSGQKTPYFCSK